MIQLASKAALIIGIQKKKIFDCLKASNMRSGKPMGVQGFEG